TLPDAVRDFTQGCRKDTFTEVEAARPILYSPEDVARVHVDAGQNRGAFGANLLVITLDLR
ncbi:MAG: hypothetical protein RKP46_14625, partial [Candidatus Accumulibacter sp.]|uniref:hypothetical protein n=1 Tax=Accumulibacter sp. TaxID=2053492 RepID=UPI0028793729